jgi:hypothetical protein
MDAGKHSDFHERSQAVMDEVQECARACVPTGWMSATLELKVSGHPSFGPLAIHHRLTNPETGAEVDDFTEDLFSSTSKLHPVFRHFGENWSQCVVWMKLNETGQIVSSKRSYRYV